MAKKLNLFKVFKISTDRLITYRDNKPCITTINLDYDTEVHSGGVVSIMQSQLTRQIRLHLNLDEGEFNEYSLMDKIISVVTPQDSGRKKKNQKAYQLIAERGFTAVINGEKIPFVRMCSSAGGLRQNTVSFVRKDLHKSVTKSLMCGLEMSDLKEINPAKFSAYFGLCTTGITYIPEGYSPRFIIVPDYEEIVPHELCNHVEEKGLRSYICTEGGDVYTDKLDDDYKFNQEEQVFIRDSDGEKFHVFTGLEKRITQKYYDSIDSAPPMNSFDGQGLASPEWMRTVAEVMQINYIPSTAIIRAPFVKGQVVNFDFRSWCLSKGITNITDIFKVSHPVGEIDVILSVSMFKMLKAYKAKMGNSPKKLAKLTQYWDTHRQQNNLLWGISRVNRRTDREKVLLNYQVVQGLELTNQDIDSLCEETDAYLKTLTSTDYEVAMEQINSCNDEDGIMPLYQSVLINNSEFIQDKYIRQCILDESKKQFDKAKLSKLIVSGNVQYIISDPIAQMEHICGLPVIGSIPTGCVYSPYWMAKGAEEICALRNPYIDRNESLKLKVIMKENKWFANIQSGLIYSIHSLNSLRGGGFDWDGDFMLSTDNEYILKGSLLEPPAALYYELPATTITGVTKDSIISADVAGFNSKIGQISNRSCGYYAMLTDYTKDSIEYQSIYDCIVRLGFDVGFEIDSTKSMAKPTHDKAFDTLQFPAGCGEAEKTGIEKHNSIASPSKPYFFRYNYPKILSCANKLKSIYGKLSWFRCGIDFNTVIKKVENGDATQDMIELITEYNKKLSVADQDSICNHIAKHYESLERELKQSAKANGENMLLKYRGKTVINEELKTEIAEIISTYKENISRTTQKSNVETDMSCKDKTQFLSGLYNELRDYYYNKVANLLRTDDIQTIFDYVVAASEKPADVWSFLKYKVLDVINK